MKKTEKSSPTYFIYEVPGVKIGCTTNPKRRLAQQNVTDFKILGEHKCIFIASFMERFLQEQNCYLVDREPYYKTRSQCTMECRTMSQETREKMSASRIGITYSQETCAKMSSAKKGKVSAFKGQKHSEETKAKIGESHKGKKLSEETIAKMLASRKENWKKRKAHEESL